MVSHERGRLALGGLSSSPPRSGSRRPCAPAFGGVVNDAPSDIYIDDVRIAADASSVCDFKPFGKFFGATRSVWPPGRAGG